MEHVRLRQHLFVPARSISGSVTRSTRSLEGGYPKRINASCSGGRRAHRCPPRTLRSSRTNNTAPPLPEQRIGVEHDKVERNGRNEAGKRWRASHAVPPSDSVSAAATSRRQLDCSKGGHTTASPGTGPTVLRRLDATTRANSLQLHPDYLHAVATSRPTNELGQTCETPAPSSTIKLGQICEAPAPSPLASDLPARQPNAAAVVRARTTFKHAPALIDGPQMAPIQSVDTVHPEPCNQCYGRVARRRTAGPGGGSKGIAWSAHAKWAPRAKGTTSCHPVAHEAAVRRGSGCRARPATNSEPREQSIAGRSKCARGNARASKVRILACQEQYSVSARAQRRELRPWPELLFPRLRKAKDISSLSSDFCSTEKLLQ